MAGTSVLLAGAPACGKTTLLFLLLAARANSGAAVALLNRLVRPAPSGQWVVLIEGEHSAASSSRKLVKAVRLLRLDDAALDRVIIVARKAVQLGSPEWQDIVNLIGEGLVSDIAIDTIARVAPSGANEERDQVRVFALVAQAIEQAPAQVAKPVCWIVAHTRKNGTSGELTDVAGSVQRVGQADSVLLMTGEKDGGRTVSTTVTFVKLRDPDEYPQPASFRIVGGAVPQLISESEGGASKPLTKRILNLLEIAARTKSYLRTTLGVGQPAIEEALDELFSQKLIRTVSKMVRGQPRKVFELAPLTGREVTE